MSITSKTQSKEWDENYDRIFRKEPEKDSPTIETCSKYKTEWKAGGKNEDFWKEVLVGRRIERLEFDAIGVTALVLDNGEKLFFMPVEGHPRFFIKDP